MIKTKGFTLIEVMLVNAIMAVVIGVVALLWQFLLKNYDFTMSQFQLTENANYAVRKMETELRQAKEAMQGAYPLAILDDNQIAFYADIDHNGSVERLRYFVLNGNLMRGKTDPSGNPPQYNLATEKTTIVVSQVTPTGGPLFTYYNLNWPRDTVNNPLPPALRPLETRLVKIHIPITLKSQTGVATQSAEATVQIRNLKDNL